MIEIVFGESAEGSLKVAQRYGKGKYPDGTVSVFLCHKDGCEAMDEELEVAKQEYMKYLVKKPDGKDSRNWKE